MSTNPHTIEHLLGVVPVPLVIANAHHVGDPDSNGLYLVHKDVPLHERMWTN